MNTNDEKIQKAAELFSQIPANYQHAIISLIEYLLTEKSQDLDGQEVVG